MGDPQGRTAAYESFIQDISDRRRLEEELRRRERLAAVGSTVAVLTHELSNPLTGMYATIELLERRLKGKETDNPDLVSALCALRTETYRMGDLVNDFRSLAQTHYAFEPVSLPEVISELLKIQESNYAELGIRVETRFPPVSPPVMGDRNKLKQALLNLLKNGVEAMPGGGVLTINADVLGSQMALEIRDTGCGIPDGVDIFEPFVTTKEYGTGLGLPLVRQIVNEHGGVITHGSRPGQGTFFRLLLPVRSLEKKTAQAARIDGDGEPGKPIGESGEIKVYERNR